MSLRGQVVCACRCHEDETGGPGVVNVADVIGAATACGRCQNAHTSALRCEVPELEARRPARRERAPWVDAPDAQAEGWKGDGGG